MRSKTIKKLTQVSLFLIILFVFYSKWASKYAQKELSLENYCIENPEWLALSEKIFIKRTFLFYYIEQKRFTSFLILNSNEKYFQLKLEFHIYYKNKLITKHLSDYIKLKITSNGSEYKQSVLEYFFDLEKLVSNTLDNNNVKIKVYFLLDDANSYLSEDLNVKIKFINNVEKQNGVLLCMKCLSIKTSEWKQSKLWLEINKKAGYSKINICNQSIPNINNLNLIFEQNKNFVNLYNPKCMPNFIKNITNYLNNFNDIFLKECQMENLDKYQYISIVDLDETILPKLIETHSPKEMLNFNCKNDKIENLFNKLSMGKSINFHRGFYLKYQFMEYLFEKFKKIDVLDKKSSFTLEIDQPYGINGNEKFYYKIKIENNDAIEHARYLYKTYFEQIKPFREKNKKIIESYGGKFDRLFYRLEKEANGSNFKTVFNTNVIFDSVHNISHVKVSPRHAIMSSFKEVYQYDRNNFISIKQIQLDLNYFNCFFIPILRNLSFVKV
ncbi:unnamed protein product [Brachionus calyciflorus]|uniref:Glycosyltransferase family 92 protein n=1 Tax=Brachionus calyciflorus TaxID=104777 RepID=A0A814L116_9BILA|nr:unnamed protein product [Brachionus calyciflorus]